MAKLKLLVSFKESERDLYDLIMEQGDKSNFVKDAVKDYIRKVSKPSFMIFDDKGE